MFIQIGSLDNFIRIVLEAWAYPAAADYWDANWIKVRFLATTNVGLLESIGTIHAPEIEHLRDQLQKLLIGETTTFEFRPMEPFIEFKIAECDDRFTLVGSYSPDPGNENKFPIMIDTTRADVDALILKLDSAISKFPVRNASKAFD